MPPFRHQCLPYHADVKQVDWSLVNNGTASAVSSTLSAATASPAVGHCLLRSGFLTVMENTKDYNL